MPKLSDYLPVDPNEPLQEGVMGGMVNMDPIGRMLQLAGVQPIEEEVIEEADAAGAINQLVQQASNLPQYKGNAEAARLYTIGALLTSIYQNIQANPPQTVMGQTKMKGLSVLGAMGADLVKSSQTMTKPVNPQAAGPASGVTAQATA